MKNKLNLGVLSASLYVSFQVIANVLSTKIVALPLLHWAIDGGTIIYPLTFTLRDFVHKTLGKKQSRYVVITAGMVSLLSALLFWLIGKMSPDASWVYQEAYNQILLPIFRITIASIVAQIISELIDTELFSKMYHRFSDVTAVFISNSIALVVDSIVFSLIAFAGALPMNIVIQIIATNVLIKFLMSVLSIPTIKLIPRTVEENEI